MTKQILKQRSFQVSVEKKRSSNTCVMCSGEHAVYQCKQFETKTPEKRSEYVQTKGLCFNCLSSTHPVKRCQVSASCRRCGRRHHTLLHYERTSNQESAVSGSSENSSTEVLQPSTSNRVDARVVAHFAKNSHQNRVLLATAMVRIRLSSGQAQIVRVLIDQGSEASFIKEAIVQSLQLKGLMWMALYLELAMGKLESNIELPSLSNRYIIQNSRFLLMRSY